MLDGARRSAARACVTSQTLSTTPGGGSRLSSAGEREREKSLSSKRDGSLGGSDALPLKERLNVASWLLSEGRRGGEVSGKLLLSTEANSLL